MIHAWQETTWLKIESRAFAVPSKPQKSPHPDPLPSDGRGNSERTCSIRPKTVRQSPAHDIPQKLRMILPLPSDGRGPGRGRFSSSLPTVTHRLLDTLAFVC